MPRLALAFLVSSVFLTRLSAQEDMEYRLSTPTDMARQPFAGFVIENPDTGYSLRFGGRTSMDWTSFASGGEVASQAGSFQDGAEIRRARLAFSGETYNWLRFKASFDITSNNSGLRDMWVEVRDLPGIGKFRVGHFKEPFGLERASSGAAQTFIERSSVASLTPNRNIGFAAGDTLFHNQVTWAAGVFRETSSSGEAQDSVFGDETGVTGRFTFLPWYERSGGRLIHFGFSLSSRKPDNGFMQIEEGMQLHQSPVLVDTGSFAVDSIFMLGLEAAAVLGPISFQGEWLQTKAQLPGGGEVSFPGFYVQGSYFLTGDHRVYSRRNGRFTGQNVNNAFHPRNEGAGAWEIAARLSKLDLDSGQIFGGVLRNASAGVNWYLNEDLKVQLDYEYSELQSFGNVHGVAVRVEFLW